MSAPWSTEEVRATVADYMAMLRLELAGQEYSKSAHARDLLPKLRGRSRGAVEMKHCNISAVLRELGYFWIPGYKPLSNYQDLLAREVAIWVERNRELDHFALAAADAVTATPEHVDFSSFTVPPPARAASNAAVAEESGAVGNWRERAGIRRDYAAREARNSSLGLAGEELVFRFEQFRLRSIGLERLADRVEHVAKTQGDGLGFDILSFDEAGGERFIEVKTTAFARETPFFATASELRFSRSNADRYALVRLFEFRRAPKCFTLSGEISRSCHLDPVSYRCSFD